MKSGFVLLILLVLSAGHFLSGRAHGQTTQSPGPVGSTGFHCSPAPCVLPPTQASEGGSIVTDPLVVANPTNRKELLLGSFDANCPSPSALGFHLSRDGGSTWQRVECMPDIMKGGKIWDPDDEPSVGYDRKGTAYIAGLYFCTGYCYEYTAGFIAVQHSHDGGHWSKPVVVLQRPGQTFPFETSLVVDTSPSSPWLNSVYVSGVMWLDQGSKYQVLVSHSSDGGATWTQVAVDPVQKYSEEDDLTRMAVGKDGTVYVTWLHCAGACASGQIMFSKSTDGGNTWSQAQGIATVTMPNDWQLPNTNPGVRVYNYPVIAADIGNGPHAGNLYVAMYTWTGSYLRVQVIRSTNGGKTWSKPMPVAPASDTHDQFFPALSVSPTGKLGVSWLDRRNDPNNVNYQAFASISTDGGRSFPNTQLTTAFSNPDTNGDYNWMGDYTGNTWAGPDFIAAWMDSSNGVDMQEVIGGLRLH